MAEIPERVQRMFNLWEAGYTYQELSGLYRITPPAVSQLFKRYYPNVDFKAEGLKRSQEIRGCLTEEEKLNLVRFCKCGCQQTLPQFVRRKGRIVKSERIYLQDHRPKTSGPANTITDS